MSAPALNVRRVAVPPVEGMTHRSRFPDRSESNRTSVPSGDHAGFRSAPTVVSCVSVICPLAVAGASVPSAIAVTARRGKMVCRIRLITWPGTPMGFPGGVELCVLDGGRVVRSEKTVRGSGIGSEQVDRAVRSRVYHGTTVFIRRTDEGQKKRRGLHCRSWASRWNCDSTLRSISSMCARTPSRPVPPRWATFAPRSTWRDPRP